MSPAVHKDTQVGTRGGFLSLCRRPELCIGAAQPVWAADMRATLCHRQVERGGLLGDGVGVALATWVGWIGGRTFVVRGRLQPVPSG